MPYTSRAVNGMVVSPHHLASNSGLAVLREGGNAVEAAIAAAATIAVVYPHMNSIGGDAFWLIAGPGLDQPIAIDACGAAAAAADKSRYEGMGHLPTRGPNAALTVAGVVSGWDSAVQAAHDLGGRTPFARLLADAIWYAENGVVVTELQSADTVAKLRELRDQPGFASVFLDGERPFNPGDMIRQPRLARTIQRIVDDGPDDFYRGRLAAEISADLADVGSPVSGADLAEHRALAVSPLALRLTRPAVELFNFPPPTQGLAALLTLGVFERLGVDSCETDAFYHAGVEAVKQAFIVRDKVVTDPSRLPAPPSGYLQPDVLDDLARRVDPDSAAPWPAGAGQPGGDTIWLGAMDANGIAVSCIQSLYWEYGSGVVLPRTGILWQNRGASFSLDPSSLNVLEPGRKPFHTLIPAMARFDDGRFMTYGCMGGEGQPQTQAAIFSRYAMFGQTPAEAIAAPRWLLGRTWGDDTTSLRVEGRLTPAALDGLRGRGHDPIVIEPFHSSMGHAGMIIRHSDGLIEGASDPRSDGLAAAW